MNWFTRKKNKTNADAAQAHVAEEERELTENDIMDEVYWLCRPASRSVPSAKRMHYRAWGELILELKSRLRYAEKKLAMCGFKDITDHNQFSYVSRAVPDIPNGACLPKLSHDAETRLPATAKCVYALATPAPCYDGCKPRTLESIYNTLVAALEADVGKLPETATLEEDVTYADEPSARVKALLPSAAKNLARLLSPHRTFTRRGIYDIFCDALDDDLSFFSERLFADHACHVWRVYIGHNTTPTATFCDDVTARREMERLMRTHPSVRIQRYDCPHLFAIKGKIRDIANTDATTKPLAPDGGAVAAPVTPRLSPSDDIGSIVQKPLPDGTRVYRSMTATEHSPSVPTVADAATATENSDGINIEPCYYDGIVGDYTDLYGYFPLSIIIKWYKSHISTYGLFRLIDSGNARLSHGPRHPKTKDTLYIRRHFIASNYDDKNHSLRDACLYAKPHKDFPANAKLFGDVTKHAFTWERFKEYLEHPERSREVTSLMDIAPREDLLTVQETMRLTNATNNSVHSALNAGFFHRIDAPYRVYVLRSDVADYLKNSPSDRNNGTLLDAVREHKRINKWKHA